MNNDNYLSVPNMEDMSPHSPYCFTVNLKDLHDKRYRIKYDSPFIELYNRYKSLFDGLKALGVSLDMYPELGSKGLRLHYHGWIRFNAYSNLIPALQLLRNCDSRIEISEPNVSFDHSIEWYMYIRKQKHLMKPYMGKLGLPYKYSHPTEKKHLFKV